MNKGFRVLERLLPGHVVWAAVLVSALVPSWPHASAATFKKVFSSTDIGAYNQWLSQHRDEYRSLPPLYISSEVISTASGVGGDVRTVRVSFFGPSGARVASEDFTGHVYVSVSPGRSAAYIVTRPDTGETRTVSVYGGRGNRLFRIDDGGLSPTDGGLYFRTWLDPDDGNPTRDYAEILDSRGRSLGRINGWTAAEIQAHWVYSSVDSTYVLPLGIGRVFVLNQSGGALWDTVFRGNVSLAITDSSRRVVVGTEGGTVFTRDLVPGRTRSFPLPDEFRYPEVGVNADGSRVAVYGYGTSALQVIYPDSARQSPPVHLAGVGTPAAVGFVRDHAVVVDLGGVAASVALGSSVAAIDTLASFPRGHQRARIAGNAILAYGDDRVSVYRLEEP